MIKKEESEAIWFKCSCCNHLSKAINIFSSVTLCP